MVRRVLAIIAVSLSTAFAVAAQPPMEAYGELPEIRSMAISPDGEHVAFIRRVDGEEALFVYKLGEGLVGGLPIGEAKARAVEFAGPDHAILRLSDTTWVSGYLGRFEFSAAFSYSLRTKKVVQLLGKSTGLVYPAQSGLGIIVGLYDDHEVLMPAYTRQGNYPSYDLLRVDLESGRAKPFQKGIHATIDWLADPKAGIFVREDYQNESNKYVIRALIDQEWRTIFTMDAPIPNVSLVGLKSDRSAVVISDMRKGEWLTGLRMLDFNGQMSLPIFDRADAEIDSVLSGIDRVVVGVGYSGFYPSYAFFDPAVNGGVAAIQAMFENSAVKLLSWSDDFSKLLFKVEGGETAGIYYVFDRPKNKLIKIIETRPKIPSDQVAQMLTIEYRARDGLTIPALLTMPMNGKTRGLPMIVMPHGGPASYDAIEFNWRAQFFASRGYLVFQPNFRGSAGFGRAFREAGNGEWGGKMQDDITDGVRGLIQSGYADPGRICIVGGSYGGYAALAGGAFTPDLYKCVAAIAPVADIPLMLRHERRDVGKNHWVLDYWKDVIGDPKEEEDKLEAISPINHAEAFKAPVLLIHGKDDLVVPIVQSARMESALKRAGKSVKLIRLAGEDHYLSRGETRLETLKALDDFVTEHLGAN